MFPHFLTQNINQAGVHKLIVVGDEEAHTALRCELFWKFLPQPLLMSFLHDDNHVRPPELPSRHLDPCCVFSARRANIPSRLAREDRFCRQATSAVATTNEQNFHARGFQAQTTWPKPVANTIRQTDSSPASRFRPLRQQLVSMIFSTQISFARSGGGN